MSKPLAKMSRGFNVNHFLVERAFLYDGNRNVTLVDCSYDDTYGAWFDVTSGDVLVKSSRPGRPEPQSKKHDIETGEDQKGE